MLDSLANRALAQGTNAWTDTDHTCYTISTAGSEGFLNIMPVYLDHLFHPTLTPTAFHTEIHHIDADGDDKGVVYAEMQGREHTEGDLLHLRMSQALYPATTGYYYETGGRMANLRDLALDKVRQYHASFYRPDNTALILTGPVEAEAVFAALAPVEAAWLSGMGADKGADTGVRPWANTHVPPLTAQRPQDGPLLLPFPDQGSTDGETNVGTVVLAWQQGIPWHDLRHRVAMDVLSVYLADSAVAPFNRRLVDCAQPLCSDVDVDDLTFQAHGVYMTFSGVPVSALREVAGKAMQVFREMVGMAADDTPTLKRKFSEEDDGDEADEEGDEEEGEDEEEEEESDEEEEEESEDEEDGDGGSVAFDPERMRVILHRYKQQTQQSFESDPHSFFAMPAIYDFLYGRVKAPGADTSDFRHALDERQVLAAITATHAYPGMTWEAFIRTYVQTGCDRMIQYTHTYT